MNTIYLDFDNTIVESNKRVIKILNDKYNISKTESDLTDYHFNSIYPISEKEKLEIFESDEFYNNLELKPGVMDVLNKYFNFFNIVIVSKGTKNNLLKKEEWIKKNLPFNFKFIGLKGQSFNKKIDMKNSIQIDDNIKSLDTNASLKILYKNFNEFPWQKPSGNEEYIPVDTWEQIDSILNFYKDYNCETLEEIR